MLFKIEPRSVAIDFLQQDIICVTISLMSSAEPPWGPEPEAAKAPLRGRDPHRCSATYLGSQSRTLLWRRAYPRVRALHAVPIRLTEASQFTLAEGAALPLEKRWHLDNF